MTGAAFALEKPHTVLVPDLLLTPDGPETGLAIAIDGSRIAAIVRADEVSEKLPGWPVVQLAGRAIVPGFVDAHIHLGQAFGKAVTCGEPSQIWQRIWIPLEKMLDPSLTHIAAKWMFLEALRGGYTTIVNFAIINPDKAEAIHRAATETGVRLVSSTGSVDRADYHSVSGLTPNFEPLDAALKRAEIHIEKCRSFERITPSLCVSGVQGATPALIGATADLCRQHGIVFQIHANEHHPEVHACIVAFGKRPIHHIADSGGLDANTLVHHAAVITESEIEVLRRSGAAVTYNPCACQWKLDAVTPALKYVERRVRMGLGTDSTRSDAFRMLDAAESCQRVTIGMEVMDFSCGAGWTWVQAATAGGADACGLGHLTGRLSEGYRADLLILDMNVPEALPSWDFEWELVRFYNRDQILAVVIDGEVVMNRGRAIGWDQDKFLAESLPKAMDTVRHAKIVRRHATSREHRQLSHS